jgi:OOP family OmpA-OmpF porin
MHAVRRLSILAALLALAPRPARAFDLAIAAEPGVAGPIGEPQASHFGVGGGALLAAMISVNRFTGVEAVGGFLGFSTAMGEAATIGTGGAGVRFHRSHRARGLAPWGDADLLYVRTGTLDRFGFTFATGVSYPLKGMWVGLFARYLHVIEPQRDGYDSSDAKVLIGGVTVEVDRTIGRAPYEPPPPIDPKADTDHDGVRDIADKCPASPGPADNAGCPHPDADGDGVIDRADRCPKQPGPAKNAGCPDGDADGDGVIDREDQCPELAGAATAGGCPDRDGDKVADAEDVCPDRAGEEANHGCPRYLRVTVTSDKLELSQKIFFSHDGDELIDKSFALLDEVAEALRDHPGLKVRIEGHTDGFGRADHNLRLSLRRAEAVRNYLVAHGVAGDRLEARGYGATQRLESDATFDGRERNRRVEFVILK